ncbi:MAG: hypothetical protein AAB638_00705 [Patescibacteria group bacterium]
MKTIKVLLLFVCLTALMSFTPPVPTVIYNGAKITLASSSELEVQFGDAYPYRQHEERTAYVTIISAATTVQIATRTIDSNSGTWITGDKVPIGFINITHNIRLKGTSGDIIQITHSR